MDDSLYENYKDLYVNTIGRHGQQIVEGIRKWNKATSKNFDKEKNIVILESPLTYQSLLTDNPQYKNLLPENVKKFYNF